MTDIPDVSSSVAFLSAQAVQEGVAAANQPPGPQRQWHLKRQEIAMRFAIAMQSVADHLRAQRDGAAGRGERQDGIGDR